MTTPPQGPGTPSGRPDQPTGEPQPTTAPQPVQDPKQAPLPPTAPQPVKGPGAKRTPSPPPGPSATPPSPSSSPSGAPPKRVATGATRVIPSQPPPPTPRPGSPKPSAASASSDSPQPPDAPPEEGDESDALWFKKYLRLPGVLIGLGILAASLLGSLVYYLFFRPEPVTLAPEIVVIPLPTPTFDVYIPPDPTSFVGRLPWSTMTYGLTTVEEMPSSARTTWPERYAEAWLLTYTDGSDFMTVEAYQHYYEDDAIAAFEALWAEAEAAAQATAPEPSPEPSPEPTPSVSPAPLVERHPVHANRIQVGESFKTTTEVTETIEGDEGSDPVEVTREIAVVTWRNATAVFIMTTDAAVVDDLFLEYGV